jgi:hypothetical protein
MHALHFHGERSGSGLRASEFVYYRVGKSVGTSMLFEYVFIVKGSGVGFGFEILSLAGPFTFPAGDADTGIYKYPESSFGVKV